MFGRKEIQIVPIQTPLFSWGEIKESLNSFPYERCLRRIKEIRKAKEVLDESLKYLGGEEYQIVKRRINELTKAENEAIKELRNYVIKALAKIVIKKLMEEVE